MSAGERPSVHVDSIEDLRAWLDANAESSDGALIVTWKKGTGPYVSWGDVVPELLAHGWIDSKTIKFDEDRRALTITPRNPKSAWSRRNKEIIETLEAEGRMAPAGKAMVALAKETGTWNELDAVEALEEPPELAAALDANTAARQNWDAFPRSAKRLALMLLHQAKREETRARRVAEIVEKAARNERVG